MKIPKDLSELNLLFITQLLVILLVTYIIYSMLNAFSLINEYSLVFYAVIGVPIISAFREGLNPTKQREYMK